MNNFVAFIQGQFCLFVLQWWQFKEKNFFKKYGKNWFAKGNAVIWQGKYLDLQWEIPWDAKKYQEKLICKGKSQEIFDFPKKVQGTLELTAAQDMWFLNLFCDSEVGWAGATFSRQCYVCNNHGFGG